MISEKEFKQISNDGWAAMLQHYFLTAVIPDEDENFVFQAKQKKKWRLFNRNCRSH